MPLVLLDPAHGGSRSGIYSNAHEKWEKDVALDVALVTRELMRAIPVDVRMTREEDHDISIRHRAIRAGSADLTVHVGFVSEPPGCIRMQVRNRMSQRFGGLLSAVHQERFQEPLDCQVNTRHELMGEKARSKHRQPVVLYYPMSIDDDRAVSEDGQRAIGATILTAVARFWAV